VIDLAPHGTKRRYDQGCRGATGCPACKTAHRVYCADRRELRRQNMPSYVHGTANGYKNYGCHCPECTAANTADCRPRVRAHRERNATSNQGVPA
jgi:hypothetical protein